MELTCRFPVDYAPSGKANDPVLDLHLRNCQSCQGEVFDLRRASA